MKRCKRCDREFEYLSRNRYCALCGIQVQRDAIEQMNTKSGPIYDRYVEGVRRYKERKASEEDK